MIASDSLLATAMQIAFVFCICYALVSDVRRLLIPNWIPLTLAALFPAYAATRLGLEQIPMHVLIAAIVFAAAMGFFLAGWIGGGDVKLLGAVMLWIGPGLAAEFLVTMAFMGAMLGLGLLLLRQSPLEPGASGLAASAARRAIELARMGECPYGVAIGGAALIFAPRLFGLG
jgi:prepilin peptidase CpaA